MTDENGGVQGADSSEDDDLKMAREMVEQLDPLLRQSGWSFYIAMLERQISARMGRAPQASEDFGAVFKKEFESGEIAGLMLAARLAQGSLSAAKELLEEDYKAREGNTDE
jgi:predicted Zn-dependent protease